MSQGSGQRPRVLVLGAGLSGLTLAALLDPERVDVLVLEQDFPPGRSQQFHGVVAIDDLAALDIISDPDRFHPVRQVDGDNLQSAVVEGWRTVPHGDLLAALRQRVRALGITIVSNQEEVDLLWRQGALSGVRTRPGGPTFEADLIVFADESDPRLPEQIGLRPDWLPTELMHLAKLRFNGAPAEPDRVRTFTQPASWGSPGFGLVVPGAGAVTVKVAMLLEDEMAAARHISEYLDEILERADVRAALDGLDRDAFVTEVVPIGGFERQHRFQRGRALVANDLVGVTHPLNRDGFSTTLSVCQTAARMIEEAVSGGELSPHRLQRYNDRIDKAFPRAARLQRRHERALGPRPTWQWFSMPELVPASGVTMTANSAKLPAGPVAALQQRARTLVPKRRTRM